MLEKLALPMFITGVFAMLASATITVNSSAVAKNPVEYRKVTLNYLSSGYSSSDSSCGSYQDLYSSSTFNYPTFRSKSSSSSNSEKQFLCTVTLYVVTGVEMPNPKPNPTVTVIYRPEPTNQPPFDPRPTQKPTKTPTPKPTWWVLPNPTPTKTPRP
jgi:hypothetical protein